MRGICGVYPALTRIPSRRKASCGKCWGKMHHRGPDCDEGVFVDDCFTLGMRRLSIIDLGGGHQPVFNEDRTVVVVFNGEIYNFQGLRRTLRSRGYRFRTDSDTEVIVYAYEEWGEDCVDHFEGHVRVCPRRDLEIYAPGAIPLVLLARDRLGIKPLYYARLSTATCYSLRKCARFWRRVKLNRDSLPRRYAATCFLARSSSP